VAETAGDVTRTHLSATKVNREKDLAPRRMGQRGEDRFRRG
jgi:hypothetical protein